MAYDCYDIDGNPVDCAAPQGTGPGQCYNGGFDLNGNDVNCTGPSATATPGPGSTGALSANASATGGGTKMSVTSNQTSIVSPALIASLATIGAQTYAATQTPPPTTRISPSGISIPSTGTTTLLLLGLAIVAGFFIFRKKG